tara:strand:- start:1241 stop:1660 length:420 start_codon:yes stop_codon:yes gene_type:complete
MVKTHLFKNLDYEFYNQENEISDLFKIDLNKYGKIDSKQIRSTFYSVDPNNKDPFTPELDDLIRLHFLCPGALIVVDGRTANTRFLKCNLQRDWAYCHDQNLDQRFFELIEEPLGVYNRSHINFSLGEDWYEKTKHLIT